MIWDNIVKLIKNSAISPFPAGPKFLAIIIPVHSPANIPMYLKITLELISLKKPKL